MKKFAAEFKEFITKGNVMDLAVGVIIGGAFQSIVNSLVNDILMPILSLITGGIDFSSWAITIGGEDIENPATITYGNFLAALINFLLMAIVLFLMIKTINSARKALSKSEEKKPEAPKTKKCPYCRSEISVDATRCPHCTSQL